MFRQTSEAHPFYSGQLFKYLMANSARRIIMDVHNPQLTLDELASAQNVKPIEDPETLLGGWPGDKDDGFEEEILKIRRTGVIGG